jgi:hypothetical protein
MVSYITAAACGVLVQVQILLAKPDNPGQSAFECQELALENSVSSMANLRLGMAVTMMHVIRCAHGGAAAAARDNAALGERHAPSTTTCEAHHVMELCRLLTAGPCRRVNLGHVCWTEGARLVHACVA